MKKLVLSVTAALALVMAMPVQGNAQGRDDLFRGGGGGQERGGGGGQDRGGGNAERLFRGDGGGRGGDGGARVQRQRNDDGARNRDRADRLFLNRGDNDDRRRAVRERLREERRDARRDARRDDRREWRRWKRWRAGNRYRVVIIPSYRHGLDLGWCHYHRYRAAGMRAHRTVQCHYHANWRHPSLVYVAGY